MRSVSLNGQVDQNQASIPLGLRSLLRYGSPMPPVLRPTCDKRLPKRENACTKTTKNLIPAKTKRTRHFQLQLSKNLSFIR